jgi:hypothetical protein
VLKDPQTDFTFTLSWSKSLLWTRFRKPENRNPSVLLAVLYGLTAPIGSPYRGFRIHNQTHNTLQGSFGWVISPSQRPLPDNTQHSKKTSILPPGFETAIPTSKRPHSHALDRAATGIDVQVAYRAMKYKGGVINFHVTNKNVGRTGVILLFIQMEVSGQHHALAAKPPGKNPSTHRLGSWVDPRDWMDDL